MLLARDNRLSRNVALKVLDMPKGLTDEECEQLVMRFQREAQTAAGLSHPNIVVIYDVSMAKDKHFISMEYLEGQPLSEHISRSPFEAERALDVAGQILDALEYAHVNDVIHRDIKPENIFVLPGDKVKLVDFGLARIRTTTTITKTGVIVGTPGYISPEQIKGEGVDKKSDVFSFGVTLYEMLTRKRPFGPDSPFDSCVAVIYRIINDHPEPPSSINPSVTPKLDQFVFKCLAKDPGERFQDASAARRRLSAIDLSDRTAVKAGMEPHVEAAGRARGLSAMEEAIDKFGVFAPVGPVIPDRVPSDWGPPAGALDSESVPEARKTSLVESQDSLAYLKVVPPAPDSTQKKSHKKLRLVLYASVLVFLVTAGLIFVFVINKPARITEYPVPTSKSAPTDITAGPDGNLWFTEAATNKIGKITTSGSVTEYRTPTSKSAPYGITAGPDGNLWFTEGAGKIGKITTSGSVTEYPVPTSNSHPTDITAGPDGNLWFTESASSMVGKITTSGSVTEYPIPTSNSVPGGITAGPDRNLWFTESGSNKIGKITTSGSVTEYPTPTSKSAPYGITAGPDGSIWFTELIGNIGKITTSGSVTEYPVPTSNSVPYGITAGPDGSIWFTEYNGNKIGKITKYSTLFQYPVPTSNSYPSSITADPDGNLWFTESTSNKIGKVPKAI